MQIGSDTLTHWILGGTSITALVGAGVSFGMLKADNKHVKEDLKEHQAEDKELFLRITGKLEDIHTDVTKLVQKEELRSQGLLKTRADD